MFLHYTKILILSVFLALCFTPMSAQEPKVVTLQEAIKQALENNLQVKQAGFQESLSAQDVLQSKMNLLPSVNASLRGTRGYGLFFDQTTLSLINSAITQGSGSLGGNLVVFDGFQRLNQIRLNKYQLMADQKNIDKIKNDLLLSVATKYLEALTNSDLLQAAKQQTQLSSEQLEVQQANYDVGNNTLADLSQAKSQLAVDEMNVTTAQNAYDMSVLELKQFMEMDPQIDIVLEKPSVPDVGKLMRSHPATEIYSEALRVNPDIALAHLMSEVALKNIDVNRGGFFPELAFSASISTQYSSQARNFQNNGTIPFWDQIDQNNFRSIGFTLNIPIFNNYTTRINFRKAKISYQNRLNDERIAQNNLNKIINQSVLDLRAAEKKYYSTEQAFTSAKDAFEVTKERYDVGMSNAVELATQQTAMNKAEFDFIQAKYDFIFRSKVIDFYLGRTIAFD